MGYETGMDRNQARVISLDDMVERESMARVIDRFIDICNLKEMGFTWAGEKDTGRERLPDQRNCEAICVWLHKQNPIVPET